MCQNMNSNHVNNKLYTQTLSNGIIFKTSNKEFINLVKTSFLDYSLKEKLRYIVNNANITYTDPLPMKHKKIKSFILKYDIFNNNRQLTHNSTFLNKYVDNLLSKLIYNYGYLLK